MKVKYRLAQSILSESKDVYDEHGEFVGSEVTSKVVAKSIESRRYHMVFVDFEDLCFRLSHSALKIVIWLAPRVEYETGSIILGVKKRDALVRDTGVSRGNLYRYIKELVDLGVVVKDGMNEYRINPMYLWRGSLPSNTKAIKDMISEEVGEGLKDQRGSEFL